VTLTVRISSDLSCHQKGGGHQHGDNDKDDEDHKFRRNGHYYGDRCAHDDDDHEDDNDGDGHHHGNGGCIVSLTNHGTIKSTQTPTPAASNTVTTQVDLRPQPKKGRMTGGGTFGKQRVHHGFTLHCNLQGQPQKLELNWGNGNKFHLERLTFATCVDDPKIGWRRPAAGFDTYLGAGTGRYNGAPATAIWSFTDAGESGNKDTAAIVIKDAAGRIVLSGSGSISNGNHQAH
jgi:hypothetical protein